MNKKSPESDIDDLWNYILRLYFRNDGTSNEYYSIGVQQRPRDGSSKQKSDVIVQTLSKGRRQKIIFIEDKRLSQEGQGSAWRRAADQLTNYMKAARTAKHAESNRTLFGVVTVGRYSRFYILQPTRQTLEDYPRGSGRYYEFLADEMEIDNILVELKQLTK